MKNLILLSAALISMSSSMSAQDAVFSEDPYFVGSNNSLLFLNPSFAGSNRGVRVQSAYRVQNLNFSYNNYLTWANTADFYIKPIKGAVFASAVFDNVWYGQVVSNYFSLGYAQHLQLSEKIRLIPSFQVTYLRRSLDYSRLRLGDQTLDPRYGDNKPLTMLPNSNKWNVDGSAGILIESRNLYGGVSILHLNQPDIGFLGENQLPIRTNAHLSYNFHLSDRSLLNLAGRYSMQDDLIYSQFMVTGVTFKHLITGAGIASSRIATSSNYTPILLNLGYRSNFFTANLIYERNLLPGAQYSWEVSLSYNLREKSARKTLTNLEAW